MRIYLLLGAVLAPLHLQAAPDLRTLPDFPGCASNPTSACLIDLARVGFDQSWPARTGAQNQPLSQALKSLAIALARAGNREAALLAQTQSWQVLGLEPGEDQRAALFAAAGLWPQVAAELRTGGGPALTAVVRELADRPAAEIANIADVIGPDAGPVLLELGRGFIQTSRLQDAAALAELLARFDPDGARPLDLAVRLATGEIGADELLSLDLPEATETDELLSVYAPPAGPGPDRAPVTAETVGDAASLAPRRCIEAARLGRIKAEVASAARLAEARALYDGLAALARDEPSALWGVHILMIDCAEAAFRLHDPDAIAWFAAMRTASVAADRYEFDAAQLLALDNEIFDLGMRAATSADPAPDGKALLTAVRAFRAKIEADGLTRDTVSTLDFVQAALVRAGKLDLALQLHDEIASSPLHTLVTLYVDDLIAAQIYAGRTDDLARMLAGPLRSPRPDLLARAIAATGSAGPNLARDWLARSGCTVSDPALCAGDRLREARLIAGLARAGSGGDLRPAALDLLRRLSGAAPSDTDPMVLAELAVALSDWD